MPKLVSKSFSEKYKAEKNFLEVFESFSLIYKIFEKNFILDQKWAKSGKWQLFNCLSNFRTTLHDAPEIPPQKVAKID